MNLLLCLMRPSGEPVTDEIRSRYASHRCFRGTDARWHDFGAFTALTLVDPAISGQPEVVQWGHYIGAGIVRLDNREEIEQWVACKNGGLSDMALVTRAVATYDERYIPKMLGDFGFIVCDTVTKKLVAACDAFAVKKLYYTASADLVAFASRAELLTSSEQYDVQYIAELLAYCTLTPGKTVYAKVNAVPAASITTVQQGRPSTTRYWSAYDFGPNGLAKHDGHWLATEFQELFAAAVRQRLTDDASTWAQLSGGLDSSSVVSMAQWLAKRNVVPHGVEGTITFVDKHGTGADEREYSDSVVDAYQIRNELIEDHGCWQDDDDGPPLLDQPSGGYAFYARDRLGAAIVRSAGGKALLTGLGGDHLLIGNMLFFADWIAAGKYRQAVEEMLRRSAIGHVSFWELAGRNAILPLLPPIVQYAFADRWAKPPGWIAPTLVRRFELARRSAPSMSYSGRPGRKYSDAVAYGVDGMPDLLVGGVADETLDVRHPFLDRPLVEFALRLPPELCVQPHARKWLLREATRGILPERVRTRVGKGVTFGLLAWSVGTHRRRLERILQEPILAQLGCIDGARLRGALVAAQGEGENDERMFAHVQYTLAVEAWLRARSGRWIAGDVCDRSQSRWS